MIEHVVGCSSCGGTFTFELEEEAFQQWQSGTAVHEAFPQLSAEERELFQSPNQYGRSGLGVSGMCGQCWKDKFSL